MFLVDSHCHLDGLDYQSLHKDVDDVLAKAAARDVKFCLAVATDAAGVSPYARAGGQAR
ncbi:putative metallodependent hydrolase [Salmonella enterica subsp. enterica serovar Sanjuan]|uniref:Putative metallodependent hydrolase n=1 Tax=Salmonella enterica subsp. enterica serovar Sanjuan TaxID=1160765 RepID=A0A3S4GZV1_SALET|nr:putative metallodependent hydrolase [Salmonella enterica subsp. enterica serovar Sanjuan]